MITGGDGTIFSKKSRRGSNLMSDFDDDSDEGEKTAGAAAAAAAAAAASALAGDTPVTTIARGVHRLDRASLLEDAYLQVTHSLAQHNQRAGRVRTAARCWSKRAELLLERGEMGVAQARLAALADLYQVSVQLPFACRRERS